MWFAPSAVAAPIVEVSITHAGRAPAPCPPDAPPTTPCERPPTTLADLGLSLVGTERDWRSVSDAPPPAELATHWLLVEARPEAALGPVAVVAADADGRVSVEVRDPCAEICGGASSVQEQRMMCAVTRPRLGWWVPRGAAHLAVRRVETSCNPALP